MAFTGGAPGSCRRATRSAILSGRRSAVADLAEWPQNPDEAGLRLLVSELLKASPKFAELWGQRIVAEEGASRKTVVQPEVGSITLDCDLLTVAGTDMRIVVYTAEPFSPDAEKLDLVRVIGLQRLRTEPSPERSGVPT